MFKVIYLSHVQMYRTKRAAVSAALRIIAANPPLPIHPQIIEYRQVDVSPFSTLSHEVPYSAYAR